MKTAVLAAAAIVKLSVESCPAARSRRSASPGPKTAWRSLSDGRADVCAPTVRGSAARSPRSRRRRVEECVTTPAPRAGLRRRVRARGAITPHRREAPSLPAGPGPEARARVRTRGRRLARATPRRRRRAPRPQAPHERQRARRVLRERLRVHGPRGEAQGPAGADSVSCISKVWGSVAVSRHRGASSPGKKAVGGFFFDLEAVRPDRDGSVPRRCCWAWAPSSCPSS